MQFQFSVLWIILMLLTGCSEKTWKVLDPKPVTQDEAGEAIREALTSGILKGVTKVSKQDGYFGNALIKIPFPHNAIKIANTLQDVGLGSLVDNAVLSINRAAEDAASEAQAIFLKAIMQLSFSDALTIIKGKEDEATRYLERSTSAQLVEAFSPKIKNSLDKVNATKHWETVISHYNKIPFTEEINPFLPEYVTREAVHGLFLMIGKEEKLIREDPVARITDLMKRVFALQD